MRCGVLWWWWRWELCESSVKKDPDRRRGTNNRVHYSGGAESTARNTCSSAHGVLQRAGDFASLLIFAGRGLEPINPSECLVDQVAHCPET